MKKIVYKTSKIIITVIVLYICIVKSALSHFKVYETSTLI